MTGAYEALRSGAVWALKWLAYLGARIMHAGARAIARPRR
jgi:hypothetical protein